MSKDQEVENDTQVAKSESEPVNQQASPGQQLSQAREKLGLSQQDVADRLHLRLASVVAVENDALEEGVSVTFNKGYVRLYARLVNLDAQSLLEAYDRLHVQDRQQPAKLQSFSRRVSREAHDSRWNMVTIVVVILVLGSVIAWWLQQPDSADDSPNFVTDTIDSLFGEEEPESGNDSDANNNPQEPESFEQSIPETQNQVNNSLQPSEADIADDQIQDQDPFAEVSQNAEEKVNEIANNTVDVIEEQVDDALTQEDNGISLDNPQVLLGEQTDMSAISLELASQGYSVNDDGTVDLVFTFRDDCWVSVKDVNGETMAVGVKVKGRVMEVSGLPPISIILGAPQVVDINFAGRDIDMSIHPTGRSANFQLPLEGE